MKEGGFFLIGMCFISLIFVGAAWAEEVAKTKARKITKYLTLGKYL